MVLGFGTLRVKGGEGKGRWRWGEHGSLCHGSARLAVKRTGGRGRKSGPAQEGVVWRWA